MAKKPRPKYKVGDMVYSWANQNKKAKINKVSVDDLGVVKYRLTMLGDDGYWHQLKWVNETTVSKTKSKRNKY